MSTSGGMKTLAFHPSAPGKSRQDVGVFRKADDRIPRRQEAANEHQRRDENLGFSSFRPREKPTGCRRFP